MNFSTIIVLPVFVGHARALRERQKVLQRGQGSLRAGVGDPAVRAYATDPGLSAFFGERQPRKKIMPDETALLRLLLRWRDEATRSGRTITRIVVAFIAFEAGRDGFWLARWLTRGGVEASSSRRGKIV